MPDTSPLRAEHITAGYSRTPVLRDVSLEIPRARVTTIVGPNGCGKSTLLKVLARLLTPSAGNVYLDGERLADLRPRQIATRLAVLPQNPVAPEGMTVRDLASRGRQPHQPWYRAWTPEDAKIVEEALQATGVQALADKALDELSGGQRQSAWIAMALAQQPNVLLLDEPTTYLDLAHAVQVLDLIHRLCRETTRTIVMVLHDLSLAARYSDHLVVMKDGQLLAEGPPAEVMTKEMLLKGFNLKAHVFNDPEDNLPTVVPAR
ncbi:ABC transporter ATP-binding protein [Actinomadura atramentaria]|uniref:ABC transporter ATP-binding protein n=1 Tax=Actinomadura atramentaria TaxID=1990 RepID=UPI0004757FA5|nr:ABC transporter ATP-binding protein [Actinomadura atramentaria]